MDFHIVQEKTTRCANTCVSCWILELIGHGYKTPLYVLLDIPYYIYYMYGIEGEVSANNTFGLFDICVLGWTMTGSSAVLARSI